MPYLLCPTTQLGRQISSRRPGFSILVIPQANTITYLAIAIRYASLEWTPDFLMVTVYELKVLENEVKGDVYLTTVSRSESSDRRRHLVNADWISLTIYLSIVFT